MPVPHISVPVTTAHSCKPSFSVSAVSHDGSAVVTVSGDLDQLTVEQLNLATARVLRELSGVLVIDLTPTTFLCTAAMASLLSVHERVKEIGGELVVVAQGPVTARPLQLTGLADTLKIVASVDSVFPRRSGSCVGTSPVSRTAAPSLAGVGR